MARRKAKQSANDGGSGAPAWVMTFADLMSLLMCFFVLLLSFSEMDVAKYKEVAGSMKFAFGVQRDIKVMDEAGVWVETSTNSLGLRNREIAERSWPWRGGGDGPC